VEGVRPYPEELVREYKGNRWWLETNFIDAFSQTCDRYPQKEAVVEGESRLTFSELRESSQRAALAFLELGLGPGSIVLLQVPNWVESLVIYMGLQTIGAMPVMCLPRHGQRELERFCELTGAVAWIGPVTFGRTEYIPWLRAIREKHPHLKHLIVVREEAPPGTISFSQLMAESRADKGSGQYLRKFRPSPDDVIHLAPTGGTTGLPKLVPRTANAHLTKSYYFCRAFAKGPEDVDLLFAPINHDAPQLVTVGSMVHFGTKIVLSPSTKVSDILAYVEKERATFTFLVPALMTDIVYFPDLDKYDISSLRAVISGGAHCPSDLVRVVSERLSFTFHNCYGQTEGAGTATRVDDPFEVIAHTVGKPFCPYDRYRVVDDEGNELPQGEVGELATQGPCIFSGYYKSEEENRQVFTRDNFFRTGDMAKFDPQGHLIITGRKKDIINRGGEKVSAVEVEEMIIRHPKVMRAAVVGMPDPRLGERVCAYVQPLPGESVDFEEVVSFLKAEGASVMLLPERVEVTDSIPVTAMDKVDKQRLMEDIARKLEAEGKG
jgi:non-ribosomal peptide synthetase component E (peptide arylation enzyme)